MIVFTFHRKTTPSNSHNQLVSRLIAHGLLSDSALLLSTRVVALDLVTLHYAHVCYCVCVFVCLVLTLQ